MNSWPRVSLLHHPVHYRKLVRETGRGQVDDVSKNHPSRRNLGKNSVVIACPVYSQTRRRLVLLQSREPGGRGQ